MSHAGVYVQATDGQFYKNPAIWSADPQGHDWYVCFDDTEAPEIVVKRFKRSSPESCRTRASKVMREAGIEFKELQHHQQASRGFPPTWGIHPSHAYFFHLLGPIPIPGKYDAVVGQPGRVWDNCIYGFYTDMDSEDCARAVLGMDFSPLLARALLKQVIYKKEQEKVRAEICKKLYTQVPWLRELRRDTWTEQLKDQPKTVRIQWRS